MGIDLNDLRAPSTGTAVDLQRGEKVTGTLTDVGDWRDIEGKFGTTTKSPWNLTTADGESLTLWVKKGSRLATVLGDAIRDAGCTSIVTGGVLAVMRVDDVPTDRGAMHDFKAKYTAPATAAGPSLDDL